LEDKTLTLNLTLDQTNVVIAALAKQPFEAVADLIGLIRQQAMDQLQPQATEVTTEDA